MKWSEMSDDQKIENIKVNLACYMVAVTATIYKIKCQIESTEETPLGHAIFDQKFLELVDEIKNA